MILLNICQSQAMSLRRSLRIMILTTHVKVVGACLSNLNFYQLKPTYSEFTVSFIDSLIWIAYKSQSTKTNDKYNNFSFNFSYENYTHPSIYAALNLHRFLFTR